MRFFIVFMMVLGIAGCKQNPELPALISPYRIDIQQGNVVTQEMVDKLKVGQTRSQVRFVLGSPLVVDMFHADRWDYIYLLQRQGKADERRRLTVIFDGDKLASIEGDVVLTDRIQEPVQPVAKPPAPKPPVASVPKPVAAKPVVVAPAPSPTPASSVKVPAAWPSAAKPEAAPPEKPIASQSVPLANEAAPTPTAETAKPDAAKSDAVKSDTNAEASAAATKTDAAKADDKKDAPKPQRGPFGRMLEKIGL